MSKRRASHAGSWYSSKGAQLSAELHAWMEKADACCGSARAIIAPHAGYSYSGPTAAWAYKHIQATTARRVFVLGPSHHVYTPRCALTRCTAYETPLGELTIDQQASSDLAASLLPLCRWEDSVAACSFVFSASTCSVCFTSKLPLAVSLREPM